MNSEGGQQSNDSVANAIRAGPYFDITFTPVAGTAVDASSVLDAAPEFRLSGALSENLVADEVYDLGDGVFRYLYEGQIDTGILEVTFIEGAWQDEAGNRGEAGTSAINVITEAESFFIEISGGIQLNAAGFLDEPIVELASEVIIEIDTVREVFTLSLIHI